MASVHSDREGLGSDGFLRYDTTCLCGLFVGHLSDWGKSCTFYLGHVVAHSVLSLSLFDDRRAPNETENIRKIIQIYIWCKTIFGPSKSDNYRLQ